VTRPKAHAYACDTCGYTEHGIEAVQTTRQHVHQSGGIQTYHHMTMIPEHQETKPS
jgi:hypothetical protein